MSGNQDDDSMFSRSGRSSPLGKCSARMDIPCSDKLKDDLTGLAFMHRKTLSEYVREVLEEHTYGKLTIRDRLAVRPLDSDGENVR